ncbi:helix-turn-helix domain-containing protein [Falsirhodobacter deserti]|uniref:helix-turn-helix domain-containing protein n=1 Tax=Falsirhodobacter deserti TaxID=1365611 RepID=UPI000FE3376E|nr:AraC family transcriptional regulator [Falsirhodobacter deserti]
MHDRNDVLERRGSRINHRLKNQFLDSSNTGNSPHRLAGRSLAAVDTKDQSVSPVFTDSPNGRIFKSSETHGFSVADFSEVSITSESLDWTSAFVSRQKISPYQRQFAECNDPLVSFALSGPVFIGRTINGIPRRQEFVPGSFGIIPAGVPFDSQTDVPVESLQIYVRQAIIEEIAGELGKGDPSKIEIISRFAVLDQLLEQLAIAISDAAKNPTPFSHLYVDQLASTFAARLVVEHSTATIVPERVHEGLTQRQMNTLNEYIEANLRTTLSLSSLAKVNSLSPSHFARLFKKSTGMTPYQYVLRRRTSRAQHLLSQTDRPIEQVAVDSGFGDQPHFTRIFKRLMGVTPANYRKLLS